MGRRIDVELTSARDDGTWTWRAAGARQPKGVLDGTLLYAGAKVGDVARAEADFEVEGIVITSVLPPRHDARPQAQRLEVVGPPRERPPVTSTLVSRAQRSPTGRPSPDGRGPESAPRGSRQAGPERRGRQAGAERQGRAGRPPGTADRGPGAGQRLRRSPAAGRQEHPDGHTPSRAGEGRERARRPAGAEEPAAAPRPRRLAPASLHRGAVLEELSPEQRPIAEQVLRGGIPAVRQAIEAQNAQMRAEGRPEIRAQPLLAMAEELLPRLKAAEWRDRAEAAVKVIDDISLRDLRSLVAGSDTVRDDQGRLLAGRLRQALEARLNEQRDRWLAEVSAALEEGRLVRALRQSAHPPDPTARFPADLAVRLAEAAGAAMAPDTGPERWATLLEAVADSPVRRAVKPAGLPAQPGVPLLQAARQVSGRVPALAPLLGIEIPPPPGPPRPGRPGSRPGRQRRPTPAPRRPAPAPPAGDAAPAPAGGAEGGAEPPAEAASPPPGAPAS